MKRSLLNALNSLPHDCKHRVRAALAFRNKTQSRLASETGIDPGLLSNVLNGNRHLTADQVDAIAKSLDVPASVLFPEAA